jgi:hypothetical protein
VIKLERAGEEQDCPVAIAIRCSDPDKGLAILRIRFGNIPVVARISRLENLWTREEKTDLPAAAGGTGAARRFEVLFTVAKGLSSEG